MTTLVSTVFKSHLKVLPLHNESREIVWQQVKGHHNSKTQRKPDSQMMRRLCLCSSLCL